jgi:hypothetical protein
MVFLLHERATTRGSIREFPIQLCATPSACSNLPSPTANPVEHEDKIVKDMDTTPPPRPLSHSIPDVQRELGDCSRDFVDAAIAAGRLKAKKLGSRTVVLDADLRDFIDAQPYREAVGRGKGRGRHPKKPVSLATAS